MSFGFWATSDTGFSSLTAVVTSVLANCVFFILPLRFKHRAWTRVTTD